MDPSISSSLGSWVDEKGPVVGPQARETGYRWATVTSSSPFFIQLDGDTLPLPLIPESLIEGGPPPIGSRVWVQLFNRRVIVLGVSAATPSTGKYTAFTPVFDSFDIGSGATNEGWYTRIGDVVHWQFRTQLGTSPAFTAGNEIQIHLPVNALAGGGSHLQLTVGNWIFRDASASPLTHFAGGIGIWSATGPGGSAQLASFGGAWDGTAPQRRIGSIPSPGSGAFVPFTPAVDDVLTGGGTYRAA